MHDVLYAVSHGYFRPATKWCCLMTLWSIPQMVSAWEVLTGGLGWSHELSTLSLCSRKNHHCYTGSVLYQEAGREHLLYGIIFLWGQSSELAFSQQGSGTNLLSWPISWTIETLPCVKGLISRFRSGESHHQFRLHWEVPFRKSKIARSRFSVDKLTASEKSSDSSS